MAQSLTGKQADLLVDKLRDTLAATGEAPPSSRPGSSTGSRPSSSVNDGSSYRSLSRAESGHSLSRAESVASMVEQKVSFGVGWDGGSCLVARCVVAIAAGKL